MVQNYTGTDLPINLDNNSFNIIQYYYYQLSHQIYINSISHCTKTIKMSQDLIFSLKLFNLGNKKKQSFLSIISV